MATPKLRFKEFGSEYNEYNLGKLLKSYRLGGNYSNSEIKTNLPLIKMGNLNRGSINLSKIEYISSDEIIDDQDQIQLGDLFFNTRNTLDLVGKVAIWRNELPVAYYNSNLMRLEFENNFYMNFLLNTEKSLEKLKAIASGTTSVAAIYTKDLLKVKVKIPFVDEQTKIAFFLSAVDEKISQLTRKHELLSQYKQGMMQKLFSQQIRFKADDGSEFGEWELGKLSDLAEIQGGFAFKSAEFGKGNSKVLRIGDIQKNIDLDKFNGVNSLEVPDSRYRVFKESIVMALSGATFGKLGKVQSGSAFINQRVATFVSKNNSMNDFLYQIMLSQDFYNYIQSIPSASAQPNISNQDVMNYELNIPSLAEQTKIANFLSAIDQKIEVVAQQIEQAKTWKKGLLQQMFV